MYIVAVPPDAPANIPRGTDMPVTMYPPVIVAFVTLTSVTPFPATTVPAEHTAVVENVSCPACADGLDTACADPSVTVNTDGLDTDETYAVVLPAGRFRTFRGTLMP